MSRTSEYHKTWIEKNQCIRLKFNSNYIQSRNSVTDQSSDVIQREEDNKQSDKNETTSTSNDFSQGKDMNKVSSFESTKKRRGKYAPYAPKLRAEIAMYSASHTNLVGFSYP